VTPLATDPGPVSGDVQGDPGDAPRAPPGALMEPTLTRYTRARKQVHGMPRPPTTGPMETDEPPADGQARLPSQPSNPRPRPRTTTSTHPSWLWFCPMPRCARREGALPTGCSPWCPIYARCAYQRVRPQPDAWLDTHGLRSCLACRKITPQGARCPEPRWSTAVMAVLALGNTAPPRRRHARHWPGLSQKA